MMNKSKIEWCDFSWNPVTGCRLGCEYCYARNMAHRFAGDARMNANDPQLHRMVAEDNGKCVYALIHPFKGPRGQTIAFPVGFEPTIHEYRLGDPAAKKKPANIFVCSMADLFGPWVPDGWIECVFEACAAAPWHNYMFLTKNPGRYAALEEVGKLPAAPNMWYGASVTNAAQMAAAAAAFGQLRAGHKTFASVEPILEDITETEAWREATENYYIDWVIVGAETGNRRGKVTPDVAWIWRIVETYRSTDNFALFMKDSNELLRVWPHTLIQEFPRELQRPADGPIPRCKDCKDAITTFQGKRGTAYTCGINGKHIPGRYTRTSPPWCVKRAENQDKED